MKPEIAIPAEVAPSARSPSLGPLLASLSAPMLLASLGTSIANVGLPTLGQAFNASFQQVQSIVLAYLLAITTLVVSVGRLGDLFGRRRLLLAGIALFTAASVLCGAASTLWLLVAARAVQGAGAAIMMATSMALVAGCVPRSRTGSAMGLMASMSAVGTALGPALGGVLIASIGWQAIFLVKVPLGVAALLLARRCLPPDTPTGPSARPGFDHAGMLLLSLTLAAYTLAVTVGRGGFGATNLALLAAAALGLGLFVLVETRAAAPLVQMTLLREPQLLAGFAASSLVVTVMMATLVVGPFYLAGTLALDAASVGLAMSSGPVVAALAGVPAGRMADRFGAGRMVGAGLLLMTAGCIAFALSPARLGVAAYVASLVVVTAGYALFQAANNSAVMMNVQPDQRGVGSGLLNLSRNLGLITGASVMGALFAAAGMRATFGVGAGLIGVALAVAWSARAKVRAH